MENLIILGAGGYGRTAAETARAMGVFGRVAFLDDGCTGTDVLGPCTDYIRFAGEFRWDKLRRESIFLNFEQLI